MPSIKDSLRRAVDNKKMDSMKGEIMRTMGPEIARQLAPLLAKLAGQSQGSRQQLQEDLRSALKEALSGVKVQMPQPQVNYKAPEVKVPEIKMPEIKVPDVVMPPIKFPKMPEFKMPNDLKVMLKDINTQNPLPVVLTDPLGKTYAALSQSGNRSRVLQAMFGDVPVNLDATKDGYLSVQVQGGATSGTEYTEGDTDATIDGQAILWEDASDTLRTPAHATPMPIRVSGYAADIITSVNIVSGSSSGTEYTEGDSDATITGPATMAESAGDVLNPLQLGSGVADKALRVVHATDVATSVYVTGANGTIATYGLDADGNYRDEFPVTLEGANTTISVYNLDADGNYRDVLPVNVENTVTADVTGQGDVPITLDGEEVTVAGFSDSILTIGTVVADAADDGSAPHKVGGIARQANPTAVSAGDRVSASFDDLGRQVNRPIQVRDLITTAYASLSSDAETTLLSGAASTLHDLIYVMGANQSDGAVNIDIRSGTGGSVMQSLSIPAGGTAGVSLPVPLPQTEAAQAWTVHFADSDITGSTVDVSAMFTKEV